ncbi:hypothetical protein R84981_001220 [Carnimonas sp. R-84981]
MCLIKRSIAQKTTKKGPRMMEEHASIPPFGTMAKRQLHQLSREMRWITVTSRH